MKLNCFSISALLAVLAASLSAQSPKTLTSVSTFHVAQSKVPTFLNRCKAINPTLDKLMEAGTVLSYGVDVDMLHVPGSNNVAIWVTVPDFAALGTLEKAIEEFGKANTATMGDIYSMSDAATHHDFVVRSNEARLGKVPANAMPLNDFDVITVKPGQMQKFMELFRKYDKPVLDALVDSGVIYGYSVDTEAVHTMKPGTVWTIVIMPDLGAKDKVAAAYQAASKKLSEAERTKLEQDSEALVEPGSHRDSLAVSMIFKQK